MSRDEPQMIDHDGYYIINLDKARGGYGGTHWVGLIIKGKNAYYCDSYGAYPPEMISDHLFKHYIVHYNDVKYQDNKSDACRMFTLGFLKFMIQNNYSITKFNNMFLKMFVPNLKKNDDIIIGYLQH
jgi:hypothetical protein